MSISKKKEQKRREKRREEYNKAVKHKMESAADLADKYSKVYEMTGKSAKSGRGRRVSTSQKKMVYQLGAIIAHTVVLLVVIAFIFLPFRKSLKDMWQNYFSENAPRFASSVLTNDFVGSDNVQNTVHFNDIEHPDMNCSYAKLSSDGIDSKIYFGLTEVALLEGVCQISTTSLPGLGKPVMLYGYNSTYLYGIENIAEGDIIKIITNYGVYGYSVESTGSFDKKSAPPYNLDADEEKLIICTDYPFDEYRTEFSETYYVIAERVSGPVVEY